MKAKLLDALAWTVVGLAAGACLAAMAWMVWQSPGHRTAMVAMLFGLAAFFLAVNHLNSRGSHR